MHVIQYIAVQGDDVDQAFRRVKHELEAMLGDWPESPTNTWFDWFVTGGGRWSSGDDPYNDEYTADVVHQSDPKFHEYLKTADEYRQQELSQYIDSARKLNLTEILDKVTLDDFHGAMELYTVKKVYDMATGTWDFNSYFYDIINDSTNKTHMLQQIDNGAKNWYLVPVDFHF
jgi:hypothetical protein